jgi:hypothetical protein
VAILVKSLGADNHVFSRPRVRSALPLVGLARVVDWSLGAADDGARVEER